MAGFPIDGGVGILLTLKCWGFPSLDASKTVAELDLGGLELGEGRGEVLELLVELVLHLGELLCAQGV